MRATVETMLVTEALLGSIPRDVASPPPPPKRELIPNFLIGSEVMQYVAGQIKRVARTDATVCISGETGTGKELVAKAVHQLSPRSQGPFVVIDCTSLGREIAENELFGHVTGAFTGAAKCASWGLFGRAQTGTVFLDELSALPRSIQPKLLRVLEEREYRQVGGTAYRPVDIRIIAATNQPLEELVERGEFRKDLLYRLNVFPVQVPPLRERKEEIPLLVEHFLARFNATGIRLRDEASVVLQRYGWPGNVRELGNVIRRVLITKDQESPDIAPNDLPRELLAKSPIRAI